MVRIETESGRLPVFRSLSEMVHVYDSAQRIDESERILIPFRLCFPGQALS